MKPKPDKVQELERSVAREDWPTALRIASKFRLSGEERTAIQRGHEALARPDFYRAIGMDPDALYQAGVQALRRRWGTP